jgi:hypothetical protein
MRIVISKGAGKSARSLSRFDLDLLTPTWKETSITATFKESASDREILLVGPYGVLGTGVLDAVAVNPAWRVTTAARRPAPTYRTQTPPPHISVDGSVLDMDMQEDKILKSLRIRVCRIQI